MDKVKLIGKIVKFTEPETGTRKDDGTPWTKVTALVSYGKWDTKVALQCWNGKIDDFMQLPLEREILFDLELKSREFNGRYYTEANVDSWELYTASNPQ